MRGSARGDLRPHPLRLAHQRQVGDIGSVAEPGRRRLETGKRRIGAGGVAGDQDDARAQTGQRQDRLFANAGGRPRRHNCLAVHYRFPLGRGLGLTQPSH